MDSDGCNAGIMKARHTPRKRWIPPVQPITLCRSILEPAYALHLAGAKECSKPGFCGCFGKLIGLILLLDLKMKNMTCEIMRVAAIASCVILISGCGHSRAHIHSERDISWAASSEYLIEVHDLPLKDWPKLQKFTKLSDLSISDNSDPKTLDKCLQELSQLKLPQLRALRLECGPTDEGLLALTNLPSIACLDLFGTHITDSGVEKISAAMPLLSSISFSQCTSITVNGFLSLTNSLTLKEVLLGVENLTQKDVERIIEGVGQVTYWGIDKPTWDLSLQPLKQLQDRRRITIVISDGSCGRGIDEIIKNGYAPQTER